MDARIDANKARARSLERDLQLERTRVDDIEERAANARRMLADSGATLETFLAELQARHAGAELAFLEDKVETLVKVARDMRLLPVSLHFAEWGYSTPQQQAIAASLPRVRSHAYSDALGPLMLGTGKEAV